MDPELVDNSIRDRELLYSNVMSGSKGKVFKDSHSV